MLARLLNSIKSIFVPQYKSVTATEAKSIIDVKSHLLIDVRTTGEFANGKIIGAKNIPLADLPVRMSELEKYRDKPIIVNCLSGARSASACRYLCSQGFEDVTNLSGGVGAWQSAGMKLQ